MKSSLTVKATALAAALVAVLLASVALLQDRRLGEDYAQLLRAQQDALAESVADALADKLESARAVLEHSAQLLDDATLADPTRRRHWLEQIAAARVVFDGLAIAGPDGRLIASDPPQAPGTRVALGDRPYFRRAVETGFATISDPLEMRTGGGAAVLMAAPARDARGRLAAVVIGGLHLAHSSMLAQLALAPVGRTGHFEIVTGGAEPVYVVHPDRQKLLQPARSTDLADGDIVTRKLIRSVDWELRVVLPAWEAAAPVTESRRHLAWQLGALALAAALAVALGLRQLLQPLARLREAMDRLRADPDADVPIDTGGSDERGALARGFVALLRDLQARRAELATVTDASPLGIFRTDADGHQTYANEAYLRIHGLAREEIRDGWLLLLPEHERVEALQAWQAAVRSRDGFSAQRRLRRRDGEERLVSVRTAPIVVGGRLQGHVGTVSDITEREAAARSLRVLTTIFDTTPDFVVQADRRGRVTYMNPAARHAAGLAPDDPVAGRPVLDLLPAEARSQHVREVLPAVQAAGVWIGTSRVLAAGGQALPVSHMVIAHRDAAGRIEHYSAVMRDITAEVAADEAMHRQTATLRSLAEAIPASVAVVGPDRRYRFVNHGFERWHGGTRDHIVGRPVDEVLGAAAHEYRRPWIDRALAGETVRFEQTDRDRTGGTRHLSINYIPLRLADGRLDGFVAVAQDVTQQRDEADRLKALTERDPLTGLLNRAGFEEYLQRRIAAGEGAQLALLYIDLDRFKPVNDRYGHPVGDEVLRQFGRRLAALVRPTDGVTRLGGDEFAVILAGVREAAHAERVAAKVIAAARTPFEVEELTLRIGASAGVAFGVGERDDWQDLVSRADTLLYRAKQSGRDRHAFALH